MNLRIFIWPIWSETPLVKVKNLQDDRKQAKDAAYNELLRLNYCLLEKHFNPINPSVFHLKYASNRRTK